MSPLRWQSLSRKTHQEEHKRNPLTLFRTGFIVLLFLLLGLTLTALILEEQIRPVLHVWAEAYVTNQGTRAISQAVEKTMGKDATGLALAVYLRDPSGALQGVQYDMGAMNQICATLILNLQGSLLQLEEEPLRVPLGQLLGLDLFAALGPTIPIRMIPLGSVVATPLASFESAGINQTWHRVVLDVRVTLRVLIPFSPKETHLHVKVPILEEIFFGAVPSWYFLSPEYPLSGRL